MFQSQMLIDGQDLPLEEGSGRRAVIYNPANQEAVAEVAVGRRQDARLALRPGRASARRTISSSSAL